MAPPGSEDPSSEDDSFSPLIDFAAPSATVYPSIPVAGFSHDASGPHISAHNNDAVKWQRCFSNGWGYGNERNAHEYSCDISMI